MQLLKSLKNELFDIVNDSGFSPSSFSIVDSKDATTITYNDSDFYFSINFGSDDWFNYNFSPSAVKLTDKGFTKDWDVQKQLFGKWVRDYLKKEIQIDKWQQLKTEMPQFKVVDANNEGKFSYEEVMQIETKVYLLKEKVKQIPLTADQIKVLNEKLDYSIELAKTANKFDWASFFLGVITNIIIAMAVTPENSKLIWEAVKQVFSGFLLM